jgi:hypothetical protein
MVSHYDAGAALRQKVGALAGRREPQARDVFDVHHLLSRSRTADDGRGFDPDIVERACMNAMSIDFRTFKSQVLAYLEPDDQKHFDSSSVWDTLVLEVVDALRGNRS